MYLPNMKSVALPVTELTGGSQKLWAFPDYAHTLYSTVHPNPPKNPICLSQTARLFIQKAREKECTLVFPTIFDCSFDWGLRTTYLGEGEIVEGRRWYRSKERW